MSPRLPRITANELMRALRRDGWCQTRQVGSHVVMRNDAKAGRRVVVPAHAGKTMVRAELHGHPLITGEVEVKRADLEYYAAPAASLHCGVSSREPFLLVQPVYAFSGSFGGGSQSAPKVVTGYQRQPWSWVSNSSCTSGRVEATAY